MNMQTSPLVPEAGAVLNPANPAHFLVLQPVAGRVRVYHRDVLIASTVRAIRVIEIGQKVYEPRIYVPAGDLARRLDPLDRMSHCPLKGHARYFAHGGEEISWRYDTYDFARGLDHHHAFWSAKVRIEEGG